MNGVIFFPTVTGTARGRGQTIFAKQNPYDLTTGRYCWYLSINNITIINCPELYFAVKVCSSLVLSNSGVVWAKEERAGQPEERFTELETLYVARFYQPFSNKLPVGSRDITTNLDYGNKRFLINNPSDLAVFHLEPLYIPRPDVPTDPPANVFPDDIEVVIHYSLYKI